MHPDCLLRGQYDNATLARLDLERGVVWTQFEVMTLRQVVNILLPFLLPGLVTSIVVFRGLVCQGESFRFFVFFVVSFFSFFSFFALFIDLLTDKVQPL